MQESRQDGNLVQQLHADTLLVEEREESLWAPDDGATDDKMPPIPHAR